MIRIAPDNIVWWRVDVPDRDDDGELAEKPVRFRLRIFTRAELRHRALDRAQTGASATAQAMHELVQARAAEAVQDAFKGVEAALARMAEDERIREDELRERIVGWNAEDLRDEHDQPVPFTPELRDALLADEARFEALHAGLLQASRGARPKNSLPGPAGSPVATQGGAENSYGASGARPN